MNQKTLGFLFQLNQEAWARISGDPSIPQSVKTMVYLHLMKPWVPNFLAIAIAPLRPGLDKNFERSVFEWSSFSFNYPSKDWWLAHATTSHPPEGSGCSVEAHTDFLSPESTQAEFAYVNVLRSGEVVLLGPRDFEAECAFWKAGVNQEA